MATTTRLKTKVTYELVTTDANGKETRQQKKKVEYLHDDFDRDDFAALLVTAASVLNS